MGYLIKHIAISFLMLLFLGIVLYAVRHVEIRREGFFVNKARDCSCTPGFVPQKCGDPVNLAGETLNSCHGVSKDSYFCQSVLTPKTSSRCA